MKLSILDILLTYCINSPPVCGVVVDDGGCVDGVGVMVRVGSSPTEPIQPRPSIVSGDRVGD